MRRLEFRLLLFEHGLNALCHCWGSSTDRISHKVVGKLFQLYIQRRIIQLSFHILQENQPVA